MNLWTSKKGLSPLIAAVLLIVVVVGIGAVVTGIVRNYVTESKQTITEKASDMKCGVEISARIPVVLEEYKICNTSDSVNFTLENDGSGTIDELQVKFFGANGFNNSDEVLGGDELSPGETRVLSASYSGIGELQQVKIVPRVKVVGRSEKAFCTDASLTFTDIPSCS